MTDFVDIDATIDPATIGDGAVSTLNQIFANQGYAGWAANDASLEILLLFIMAQWAADCAQLATQARLAIFRAFGTKLLGVPYLQGAAATGVSLWTLADTAGYTIPAGTFLTVGTQGFYTQADVTVPAPGMFTANMTSGNPSLTVVSSLANVIVGTTLSGTGITPGTTVTAVNPGANTITMSTNATATAAGVTITASSSTAEVTVVAVDQGTDYNGLTGPVALVENLGFVSQSTPITMVAATSGGAVQESDDDYIPRLAGQLALQAPRPITAADYATFTASVPASVLPSGVVVGRTTALDGYSPAVETFTASTTSGSPVLTAVSSFAGLTAGTALSGVGIPAGATIVSMNVGASTVTMSVNASGSAPNVTVTGTGGFNNARTVTVFVTDPAGNALSGPAMTAIQTWLRGYRELNFLVYVQPPSYTQIYVTYQIHPLPGFDAGALVAAVNQQLLTYLSPGSWGNPAVQSGGLWLNSGSGFNIVRFNKILGIIEGVRGVDYVPVGGLQIGTGPSPSGTSDIVMGGPAPLPLSDVSTPTIVGSSV